MSGTSLVPVVTAAQARELDARTIRELPDSYTLMHRAADAAVAWLDARDDGRSAAVFVGPGNNGGDGWLIAGGLRARGWRASVHVAGEPRTGDAQRARSEAEQGGAFTTPDGQESLVLDALLGTGATGAPRDAIAGAMVVMREHVGTVVAIDLPSALDATTGDDGGAVPAAHTLSFGSVKRGQLLRRDLVGALHVLDIGLVAGDAVVPRLVSRALLDAELPNLRSDAYKRTRGRVAIVGGDVGMAGAVILAARGAHASGAGMVRVSVDVASATALQVAVPFATVETWSAHTPTCADLAWPDALVIGPGLDGGQRSVRGAVVRLLQQYDGPVLLDAGALSAFAENDATTIDDGDDALDADADALDQLRHALRGRPALLTPHLGEFRRLFPSGAAHADSIAAATALAARVNATVLLKGVPTVIASPGGEVLVSAAGNVALAMGGSGDLLSGIAGALLAQHVSPLHAGAIAAFVHGTAAERATRVNGGWRGVTMETLLVEVARVWHDPADGSDVSSRVPEQLLRLPDVPTR